MSRVLIRDVFGELESRGYVARKRGKGTVINTHVCLAQPRIDEEIDFVELIRIRSMEPSVRLVNNYWVTREEADLPRDAAILTENAPLLCTERIDIQFVFCWA